MDLDKIWNLRYKVSQKISQDRKFAGVGGRQAWKNFPTLTQWQPCMQCPWYDRAGHTERGHSMKGGCGVFDSLPLLTGCVAGTEYG